jgi:YesN/AraC family two-component response regulator
MYKVVIADDEDIIVSGLSQLLPWDKYNCSVAGTAGDGHAALEMVRETKPDILFTDIRMPGMDGLSLIAALRSEFPQMQVTILSGYPDFEYAQRAIRLGVSNYILKPSKMIELEDALAKMADRLNILHGKTPAPQESTPPGEAAGTPSETDGQENAGNFIINNAIKYLEEHHAEKLTLPEVANHVYVSQWHLSKLIAKIADQSFSDLLNGIRIREAKELLADPSLKIWEISERVGFSDVTHFSRIFKKMENRSANEYRNSLSAQN